MHCRGVVALAVSLALLGCSGGGGGGTEAAPSSGDEPGSSSDTSDTSNPPTGSSSEPGGTDTTSPGEVITEGDPTEGDPTEGDPTEGDPSAGPTTETSGDPPVEECHLADDNVECNLLVERSGAIAVSSEHLYPPASFKAADEPTAAEACDIYGQDCPEGQKCTVIGQQWNEVACVPLTQFPRQLGEYCGQEGDGDTCDVGLLCQWDALIMSSVCKPLCGCGEASPTCSENERCVIYNNGLLPMCERLCDPLDVSTCKEGEVCIKGQWVNDFFCRLDASAETGKFRDACDKANGCDPGYSCEAPEYVPGGCPEGAIACCTPMCDLDDPQCPEDSKCYEYFGGFGLEPAQCLEDVGFCTVETAPLVERGELRLSI
ncbi:hypothetical protein [Nannocystis exedens]|uniref:hypothetical protein n=1 Tax=Nannocystis exedens TaxID=54 RepID=UPI000BBA0B98|nr:hypothetical protein [Nannocystis exedens]